jgi:DNA polymerase III gamma/tau subunit
MELYKRFRPTKFKQVIGQPSAVSMLNAYVRKGNVPHAILFTGPSGCGKTTLSRILATKLNAVKHCYKEINCGTVTSPIDEVRQIEKYMYNSPLGGDARVWCLDEVQSLSRAKFAQQGLLKILEDPPDHAYFFLCTTDPHKLVKTIMTRCTEIKVRLLTDEEVQLVVMRALPKGVSVTGDVMEKLVEVAEGSARKALVLLDQIIGVEGDEEQLACLVSADTKKQAIEIARALINPRVRWSDVASLLKEIEDEPETIRRLILSYANSVVMGGGKLAPRAAAIIDNFMDPLYDVGKPGLTLACWRTVNFRA